MKTNFRKNLEKTLKDQAVFFEDDAFIKKVLESENLSDEQLSLIVSNMRTIRCNLRHITDVEILESCADIALKSSSPEEDIVQYLIKLSNKTNGSNQECVEFSSIKDSKCKYFKNLIASATSDFEIELMMNSWNCFDENDISIFANQIETFRKLFNFFNAPHVNKMLPKEVLITDCWNICIASDSPAVALLSHLKICYDYLYPRAALEKNFCYLNTALKPS